MYDEMVTVGMERKQEVLALYHSMIGEDGCTWSEDYPSEETFRTDAGAGKLFGMQNEQGELIALISIDEDELVKKLDCWKKERQPSKELSRLVVRKDRQNEGIARKMLLFAMEQLRRMGMKSVHFLVSPSNQKAVASYGKLEFDVVGECDLYEHHWLCYEKEL